MSGAGEGRRAALFDLDRTLVRVNTAALYMQWQLRRGEVRRRDVAMLAWWLARYRFGVLDAEAIAARAARGMAGQREEAFREALRDWAHAEVIQHVAEAARREVARRHAAGDACAILTSSTLYGAEPVARELGIEHVLASRLEVVDGCFTGGLELPLCYGQGKVVRAEAWAREHGVDLARSAFFTDSISDLPMLERVGEPVVVNPDPRLRVVAWQRRWRIERW